MSAMKWVNIAFLLFFVPALLIAQSGNDSDKVEETGGIFPSEVQGADTNEILPQRPDLIQERLTKPTFSKELRIAAQTQNEIRKNYYVMDGYVDLSYQGMRLQADHAEYDANTKDLVATGNVVLDQTDQHLTGDKLELNLDTKLGSMYNARGFVPPQIFFWGSRLDKIGDEEYKLYDGIFTECSQIEPHWKLKSTTARMTIDKYIHFTNFTLKAKNIPVFYSPYMMWPIARDRATGFLFPSFGPNSRKGFWLGGSFFWAMSNSYDSTYWVDHYSKRGWGSGAEFRYAAAENEDGNIKYYFNDDTQLGHEWTLHGDVNQNLPGDFVAKGIVDYFSSFEYIRDYSNTLSRAVSLTRGFQGFLTKNWSYYSVNFLNNLQERDSGGTSTASFFHLPEVEFRSRNQKIGSTPFYTTLLSSFDHLGQGRNFNDGTSVKNSFQRYDIFPEISWPITYLPWLTLTPSYAYRVTYWTEQKGRTGIVDSPLTRHYTDLSFDIRGPNFDRVYETPNMGYSPKWKHAIEPQVTFQYLSDVPVKNQVIGIDSDVDFIQGTKQVTYSITNLLYSKRPVKDENNYESDEYHYYDPEPLEPPVESAWEFISWRVSQTYLFKSDSFDPTDPNQHALLPISSVVRVNPTVNYNIQFTTDYDVNFHQMTRLQLNSTMRNTDRWYSNISYVYSNPATSFVFPGQPRPKPGNSLQTNDGVGLWKNKLALHGDLGYDLTQHTFLGGGAGVEWNNDCFSIGVQFRHFSQLYRTDGKENQVTFSISLPNIGNLVSFQSGASAKRY
jgi:LPS-assembly protein